MQQLSVCSSIGSVHACLNTEEKVPVSWDKSSAAQKNGAFSVCQGDKGGSFALIIKEDAGKMRGCGGVRSVLLLQYLSKVQTGVLLITGNISRMKETAAGGIIDQRILSNLLNSFQKAASCKKNMCKKVFILHFVQFVVKPSQCQSECNQLSVLLFIHTVSAHSVRAVPSRCHTSGSDRDFSNSQAVLYRDHVRDCVE